MPYYQKMLFIVVQGITGIQSMFDNSVIITDT